ncbi:beta strand repeat-containing protein [Candidatus Spyradosoma sp. SGI.093]|uniref:beta strand repeat-containing protein n=1 Tax=Candidatus Spyradosoma sp. SGI.093 TaxID=3420583 RepID=UPI003D0564E4
MNAKRLFISTLIAAAAGLTAYANEAARTTPALSETVISEDVENLLACADQKAAESESDAENDVSSADAAALELLFSAKTDSRVAKKTADEFSTEAMMRAWIARYVVSARFAGIRSAKGTGGGLSSGGGVAVAPENSDVPAVSETTASASVSSAGTDAEIDELAHGSVVIAPLGSAGAADAETSSDAATSSASGAGRLLPASVFSVRGAFSAVPAATAFYSLASGSGVSAYTAEGDATADDSVYEITASSGGEISLVGVSGTGTLRINAVGDLSDTGGGDKTFSSVKIGNDFTGTVEIANGLVDMLAGGAYSAINNQSELAPERLGGAQKIVLNGGGLLFRGANNTNSNTASYKPGTFSTKIEVGARGGVIRVYNSGSLTLASDISGKGTLRRTDGGVLTLTGTLNLGGFTNAAATTNFNGEATIGTLTMSSGELNIKNTATIGALKHDSGKLNVSNVATVTGDYVGSSGAGNSSSLEIASKGELNVSGNFDSVATTNVSGSVSVGGDLRIARDGLGTVNVNKGGTLTAQTLTFGQSSGGADKGSILNVNSGGLLIVGKVAAADFLNGSSLNLNGGTLGTSSDSLTISAGLLPIVLGENTTNFVNTNKYDTATKAFTDTGAQIAIDDAISGAGALKVTGTGTLTLSGNNTYSGGTTIESGTLVAAHASALGTGAVTVAGGVLDISVSGGTFAQGANQTLTTTGAGKIVVSAGTFALAGAVNLSSAIEVADGANLKVANTTVFALAGLKGTREGGVTTFKLVSLEGPQALGEDWAKLGTANVDAAHSSVVGRDMSATFATDGTVKVVDGTAGKLTWNGGASGRWDYAADKKSWTIGTDAASTSFFNLDEVTFSGDANVTIEDGGVRAGTMTVADGATVSLSGGRLAVVGGITIGRDAKLSLVADSANGTKATLVDGSSVYEITDSAHGEISLAGVSGTGTLRINAVGDLSDTGGGDPSLSRMPIGSRFTGTVEVVKGLLNMQQGGEASAVESGLLGGAQKVVLNGGGLLFRNANNTDSSASGYVSRTFATAIEVGAEGGVLRVYKYGNVTLASDISGKGTLRRTDGGALTLTGTVNLGGFTNAAATTTFSGEATIGTLTLSSGKLNIGNTATIGTLNLSRDGVMNVNCGGALIAASINSDGIGGSSLNLNGGTLGTSSNSLTISGGSLPIVLGENTTNFVNTNKYDTETKTFTNSGAEIVISDAISGAGALKLSGAGSLTLSGNNTFSGGVTIESGRLVVGSATALGTGTVTVGAKGELVVAAGVTITDVSGGIVLAPGAKIVVDFSKLQNATETFEVTLAEGTAVSLEPVFALAAGTTFSFREIEALDLTNYLELKGWDKSGWTSSLAYAGNTLKLTMSIPEPSQFGLLAGLAALALVGTRRRRRK